MKFKHDHDDHARLKEMAEEEESATFFGLSVEGLRKQRRDCGQLITGPYAGCSPDFARTMESIISVGELIREAK